MDYKSLPDPIKRRIAELPTPFFLFDLDGVAAKLRMLREALSPDQVYYAVKCNSLPPILSTLAASGCGFEANNADELNKVLDICIPPERIINSSPIASARDVRAMYAAGVRTFAFDAGNQVDNLKQNAPEARCSLRIYTTNEGSAFDLSKRLGVHVEDAPSLLNYAVKTGLSVTGLTFHVGSQCTSLSNWREALLACSALFRSYPDLRTLNIGGGFPVCYNGAVPSISEIGAELRAVIAEAFDPTPEIHVEPGRFIVGDAALTCAAVTQADERFPRSRAIVDLSVFAGMIEIIESGNGFRYPLETDSHGEPVTYQIGGASCAGTDILAKEVCLPRLQVDHRDDRNSSRIYFLNTGAYTLDYIAVGQKAGFNGSRLPGVYYLKEGRLLEG
jgi:ornithine decarboxylase